MAEADDLVAVEETLQQLERVSFVAHRDAKAALPAIRESGAAETRAWIETARDLFLHDREAGKAFMRHSARLAENTGVVAPWIGQAREFLRWVNSHYALEGFLAQADRVWAAWSEAGEREWFAIGLRWCGRSLADARAYFETPFDRLDGGRGVAGLESLIEPAERLFDERGLALDCYLAGAPMARNMVGDAGLLNWARRGADLLAAGRSRGEAYFRMESEEGVRLLLEALPGYRARVHGRFLQLLLLAWLDAKIPLADGDWKPGHGRAMLETDGRRLYLPAVFDNRDEAIIAVQHAAAHLAFDSYAREHLEALFARAGMEHPPLDDESRITWRPLFAEFAERMFRFQILFDLAEDLRVNARLHPLIPGFLNRLLAQAERHGIPEEPAGTYYRFALDAHRALLRAVRQTPASEGEGAWRGDLPSTNRWSTVDGGSSSRDSAGVDRPRPPSSPMRVPAATVARSDTGSEAGTKAHRQSPEMAPAPLLRGEPALDPRLQRLLEPDATLLDAWDAAQRLYADPAFPEIDIDQRRDAYLPGLSLNAARPVYPQRLRAGDLSDFRDVGDAHEEHRFVREKQEDAPEQTPEGAQKDPDADIQLPREETSGSGGRIGVGIPAPAQVAKRGVAWQPRSGGIPYPEWDYREQRLISDWVNLNERMLDEQDTDRARVIAAEHAATLKRLTRALEMQRPMRMAPLRKQMDGDELDTEAVIDFVADKRAGLSPKAFIYRRRAVRHRDTAVLLLADMSTSIMARHPCGDGRIVDRLRSGLMLFAEAIDRIGDPCAIAGFASKQRDQVHYYWLKDFTQPLDDTVRGRIAGISGRLASRMGAAIRHSVHALQRVSSQHRLLLIVSDGRPADYDDGGDSRYLHEDTRMAMKEAVDAGIHPFCITLDPSGQEYLPAIFGPGHYTIIDHVDELPRRLPEIYLRLRR